MEKVYLLVLAGMILSSWPALGAVPAMNAAPAGSSQGLEAQGLILAARDPGTPEKGCRPTPSDALGPFYKPNAPVRAKVGDGYILTGTVRSSKDCATLPGARIEFWLAGPDGNYDDAHRATAVADAAGAYRFESNVPVPYSSRPPHIHVRVTAPGFKTLVTQHYPEKGQTAATLDLVLVPGP